MFYTGFPCGLMVFPRKPFCGGGAEVLAFQTGFHYVFDAAVKIGMPEKIQTFGFSQPRERLTPNQHGHTNESDFRASRPLRYPDDGKYLCPCVCGNAGADFGRHQPGTDKGGRGRDTALSGTGTENTRVPAQVQIGGNPGVYWLFKSPKRDGTKWDETHLGVPRNRMKQGFLDDRKPYE